MPISYLVTEFPKSSAILADVIFLAHSGGPPSTGALPRPGFTDFPRPEPLSTCPNQHNALIHGISSPSHSARAWALHLDETPRARPACDAAQSAYPRGVGRRLKSAGFHPQPAQQHLIWLTHSIGPASQHSGLHTVCRTRRRRTRLRSGPATGLSVPPAHTLHQAVPYHALQYLPITHFTRDGGP